MSENLPPDLALTLRQAMNVRDLAKGYALLNTYHPQFSDTILCRNNYLLLYEISRWLAMWPGLRDLIRTTLQRTVFEPDVTLTGFAHFRLAQAFTSLVDRNAETADKAMEPVLALTGSIDHYLIMSAHFCKGRALRLLGKPSIALSHMQESKRLALELTLPYLSAVADLQIHRLYLVTTSHSYPDAESILKSAQKQLEDTGDM